MRNTFRVLIGERRGMIREALHALLDQHPEIHVLGETDDGAEVVRLAGELQPDVVLMGLSLATLDGIEATGMVKDQAPGMKVLILSEEGGELSIRRAFEAGADGYMTKNAGFGELLAALQRVTAGGRFLGPEATESLLATWLRQRESVVPSALRSLSSRELEVLRIVAKGESSQEIAECLKISPRTADKHKSNIMKKLGIHNAAALTAFAIRELGLDAS